MSPSRYARKTGIRRSNLFVIAAEGHRTEVQYFEGLSDELGQSNLDFLILKRADSDSGLSHCSHLLRQLDEYTKNNHLRKDDVLCVVTDRDSGCFSPGQLLEALTHCNVNGYAFALSNPCFELWLLLHYIDVNLCTDEQKQEIKRNENNYLKKQLRSVAGSYNPSRLDFSCFWPYIEVAYSRAISLNPDNDWLDPIGTKVSDIIELLLPTIREYSE